MNLFRRVCFFLLWSYYHHQAMGQERQCVVHTRQRDSASPTAPAMQRTFRVGVLAIRGVDAAIQDFNATFGEYLTKEAGTRFDPPIEFEMVPIAAGNGVDDMSKQDFVFANPSMASCVESEFAASSLVTKISQRKVNNHVYNLAEFGGIIFTRADNDQVNEVADLANKTVSMISISGLGSGQMQFREMIKAGLHHLQAPRQILFAGSQAKVVNTVMLGQADVGFVRTDQLERSIDPNTGGQLDLSLIKIIGGQTFQASNGEDFPFVSSTSLYPEWNVLAMPHVAQDVMQAVQETLLAMNDHAAIAPFLLACMQENGCAKTDATCVDACFGRLNPELFPSCDTTPQRALSSSQALAAAKTYGWRPTLSYMSLRTMQDEISYIHSTDDTESGVRCVRPVDIQDAVVCPPGHFKKSDIDIENGCEEMSLDCHGYKCLCKPCVEAFDVQFSPFDDFNNEAVFPTGCAKFDICGQVEQQGTIQLRAIDNQKRPNAVFTAEIIDGETSREYEMNRLDTNGVIAHEFSFEAREMPTSVLVVQVFADGVQVGESPFRLKVVERNCFDATGDSHRIPDTLGNCVCPADTVEVGDSCVPYSIFLPSVIVPVLTLLGFLVYLYVETKKREADSVWKVEPEELTFYDPERVLGEGMFGKVLQAEYRGTKVAIKKVLPPRSHAATGASRSNRSGEPTIVPIRPRHGTSDATEQDDGDNDDIEKQLSRYLEKGQKHHDRSLAMRSHNGSQGSFSVSRDFAMKSGSLSDSMFAIGSTRAQRSNPSSRGTASRFVSYWTKSSERKMRRDFIEEMRCVSRLRHPNITTVMGAVISKRSEPMLVLELMELGSLHSLLHNESMLLEQDQLLHMLQDIAQGVRFLHQASPQVVHGDLKAQNILVDAKLNAKVSDFGFTQKNQTRRTGTPLWMAPELLRCDAFNSTQTDIYSMGIVLYEVFSRKDPYEGEDHSEVIQLVMDKTVNKRPPAPSNCPPSVARLMKRCLSGNPKERPTAGEVDTTLRSVSVDVSGIATMAVLSNKNRLGTSKNKSADDILLQLFPKHVAEALKDGRKVEPESHECATVFFADMVDYTKIATRLTPEKVSDLLDRFFTKMDALCDRFNVFKIETVGDCFMAVTNVAFDQADSHASIMADFAEQALVAASETLIDVEDASLGSVQLRIGIHSGPVVTNVCGTRNQRFSVIGDTVNTASRMESHGLPNLVHISQATAKLLRVQAPGMVLLPRGKISVKGKGEMATYFCNPKDVGAVVRRKLDAKMRARLEERQQSLEETQETDKQSLSCVDEATERSINEALVTVGVECALAVDPDVVGALEGGKEPRRFFL